NAPEWPVERGNMLMSSSGLDDTDASMSLTFRKYLQECSGAGLLVDGGLYQAEGRGFSNMLTIGAPTDWEDAVKGVARFWQDGDALRRDYIDSFDGLVVKDSVAIQRRYARVHVLGGELHIFSTNQVPELTPYNTAPSLPCCPPVVFPYTYVIKPAAAAMA